MVLTKRSKKLKPTAKRMSETAGKTVRKRLLKKERSGFVAIEREMENRLNKKLDKLAELKNSGSGGAGLQGSTAAAAAREIGALFAAEDPAQRLDDLHAQV